MDHQLNEDMHVHSWFSDGWAPIQGNAEQAARLGLQRMRCVDHVRQDTSWVPDFVRSVRRAQSAVPTVELSSGLEAKLLNEAGALDLPPDHALADFIYIADHRCPIRRTCHTPREVRAMLRAGTISPAGVIESLVRSTINALRTHERVVLAHLFSILPKIGLCESDVPDSAVRELATTARDTGACIEIDERWRCPSVQTASMFRAHQVPVIFSTDSHRPETIGQYLYARGVASALSEEADGVSGLPAAVNRAPITSAPEDLPALAAGRAMASGGPARRRDVTPLYDPDQGLPQAPGEVRLERAIETRVR